MTQTVREISISGYMMTSLIIASWTFKEKSVFATLLRRYYFGSFLVFVLYFILFLLHPIDDTLVVQYQLVQG